MKTHIPRRLWYFAGIIFLILTLNINLSYSQKDSIISLDLIRAPSSPAFTILGIEPTSIEEPTNPTDLLLSVQNSTNNFQVFPTSYSLDFSPGWVFGGEKFTYQDFCNSDILNSIKQNTIVSLATNFYENQDSIEVSQIGFGIKLSLLRGKFDENLNNIKQKKDSIYGALSNLLEAKHIYADQIKANSPEYKKLKSEFDSLITRKTLGDSMVTDYMIKTQYNRITLIESQIDKQVIDLLGQNNQKEIEFLQEIAGRIKFERTGFKLDLSGGVSLDFLDHKFENREVSRYGVWLTGGNVWKSEKSSFSFFGTARFLLSPNEMYEIESGIFKDDNLRFDIGGRVIYKTKNRNFSVSSEYLYRNVLNNDLISNTSRFSVNLDCRVGMNRNMSLSLGRDFDGNFTSDGNLIAAINFVSGFGSQRPF